MSRFSFHSISFVFFFLFPILVGCKSEGGGSATSGGDSSSSSHSASSSSAPAAAGGNPAPAPNPDQNNVEPLRLALINEVVTSSLGSIGFVTDVGDSDVVDYRHATLLPNDQVMITG